MAEQVSHNVVKNSESAGAEASADVTANHTETTSAGSGQIPGAPSITDSITPAVSTSLSNGDAETASTAAEPSAGEAASYLEAKPVGEDVGAEGGGLANGVQGGEEDHHGRKNSVKKPAIFSKVSATKNFMAKTASPGPQTPKLGDRPSPLSAAPQPSATSAKPRLIAKTGAMQSALKPRAGTESAAPDAGTVWNKNRPAPPQPPKQFTDEELKQQYGIHLATRLQTDEGGKESKWADIDEDEEEWVPEAVVWMDGTKSTLAPADPIPAQGPQEQVTQQTVVPAEPPKPSLPAKRPSDFGAPKTILKPGIAAQQAKQANGSAGASPSAEKASLKAKSPAPAPSRSPWAALPPIDAISPINPPVQHAVQPARLPTQDARAFEPQLSAIPAREIAADTFDRSWREGEGTPRELFNSTNGRYEPAPEGRRNSMKPDSYRKPSVLQRPSHSGPVEPSAAFQSRRRGSSVSQGSLPPVRRMSGMSGSRPDIQPVTEREGRSSAVMGQDVRASPTTARNDPVGPHFAQQSAWEQQMPPKPEPGTEAEDPVKVQERIMREKREGAKKRRQEEEQMQEKEKQERLKARLAALEGAGKSRKEREAEAAAATVKTPANEQPPSQPAAADGQNVPTKDTEATAAVPTASEDQSQPTASSRPSVEESMPSPLPPKPQPQQATDLPERPLSSTVVGEQRQAQRAQSSPKASARAHLGQQPSPYRASNSAFSSPGERKQQPFGRSPLAGTDAFTGWSTTGSSGNVWGTSGIGNGTFEKASSFAPVPISQQNLPPPPGMARPSPSSTGISPQGFGRDVGSPSLQQPPIGEQQRAFPPPGIDSRPEAAWGQARPNGVSPAVGMGRQTRLPDPIAPPSRAQPAQQQQPPQQSAQRPDPISAWNDAAARLQQEHSLGGSTTEPKQQAGAAAAPPITTLKETFRKTTNNTSSRLGAPRRYEKPEYIIHDAGGTRSVSTLSPAPPNTQTQPIGPVPTPSPLNGQRNKDQAAEKTVRIPDGSLNPAHGGLPRQQPPVGTPPLGQAPPTAYKPQVNFATGPLPHMPNSMEGQSPPPPETTGHPVYGGELQTPNVKLPPPPPRVRLPPSAGQPPQSPEQQTAAAQAPQRPVQVWGPPGVARPIAQTPDWQARFNGLFNRAPIQTEVPPSPPKTPPKAQHGSALAVTASSRGAMDELPASMAATVSLPHQAAAASQAVKYVSPEGFTIDQSSTATSKPSIEPIFNEELSFGSLPKINVPRDVQYAFEGKGPSKQNLLHMGANSKFYKAIDAQSIADITGNRQSTFYFFHKHPQGYFLKIPGTRLSNKLVKTTATSANRKVSGMDRKASGKFVEKAVRGSKNGSGSNSPAANATPSHSRKPSFQQKASSPSVVSPAPTTVGSSPANTEGHVSKRQSKNAKRAGRSQPQPQLTASS